MRSTGMSQVPLSGDDEPPRPVKGVLTPGLAGTLTVAEAMGSGKVDLGLGPASAMSGLAGLLGPAKIDLGLGAAASTMSGLADLLGR
jgi:hypothetical protein